MSHDFAIELVKGPGTSELFQEAALLHRRQIPAGFLTSLGVPFLTRLYASLADSPQTFLLVARGGDGLQGFLCAATSTRSAYRSFMRRHAWRVLPALVRHVCRWNTLRRLGETLLYPRRTASRLDLPEAEILNFCVASRNQRQGVGTQLFTAMCAEFARRGVARVRIVTGESQVSAQRFYEAIGAQPAGAIEVHRGTRSLIYVYDIPRADGKMPQAA